MILVVALLGILFVAGAAFLQMVTFQARVIQADTESREDEAVVDQANQQVYDVLKGGFLGEGNVAYSGAGRLTVVDPVTKIVRVVLPSAYGEVAGTHAILSPIEPSLDSTGSELVYSAYTDLDRAASDRVAEALDPMVSGAPKRVLCARRPNPLNADYRDADGDGVYDSWGANVLATKPSAQWASTLNRLRASDATTNYVTVGVRVIAHGGMVDVNRGHPYVIGNALADVADPGIWANQYFGGTFAIAPNDSYPPEIEERSLRHRFVLPSRGLPESALERTLERDTWFRDTPLLVGAFPPDSKTPATPTLFRWWYFDPSDARRGAPFQQLLDAALSRPSSSYDTYFPTLAMRYDRRHLITTASYDDLLIRGVRFPDNIGDTRAGKDIVEWIKGDTGRRTVFFIDNYPNPYGVNRLKGAGKKKDSADNDSTDNDEENGMVGAAIDPRVGRIQLSLPWLDRFLVDNALSLNTLSSSTVNTDIRNQFIHTIQDMFWVMLWNYPDLNGDGLVDATDETLRAWQAASLTANLIDFADNDDVPTPVYPLVWDEPTQRFVPPDASRPENRAFGLERQPYITELYARTADSSGGAGLSAIELYNPYSDPINLATYKIGVDAANDTDLIQLPNVVLPAGDFVVLANPASDAALNSVPATKKVDLSFPALGANSRVDLARTVTWGGTPAVDVIVDRFNVTDVPGGAANFGTATPASLERDMSPWRWVVPRAQEMNSHTLGQNNATADASTVDPAIRPVQVDFANTGSLSTAYPTTGCLLLLMRHAHQYVATPADQLIPPDALPFNHVRRPTGAGSAMGAEYDQIDNGRMPVFDVGTLTAAPPGSSPSYHTLTDSANNPVTDLRAIPWGQLVLDYFTALPLDNAAAYDGWSFWNRAMPNAQPRVDQAGLRVCGRVNINAAPYKVLAGLPLLYVLSMPTRFQDNIRAGAYPLGSSPTVPTLGYSVAQAIEAYREARFVPGCSDPSGCTGDYQSRLQPPGDDPNTAGLRFGQGFLTVGELANVRHRAARSQSFGPTTFFSDFRMDGGVVGRVTGTSPNEDYVQAVARLVLLGDWVTTRSHVFTIYGTIQGPVRTGGTPAELAQSQAEARAKAIRFEDTVDRLPCFFDPKAAPQRMCQRTVGNYVEARAD